LAHPSLGFMPPYCPRRKFDSNDDIVNVKATSKRINFILHDMGASSISGEMLKNPFGDEKTRNSV